MSTPTQAHLVNANAAYSATFSQGNLPLPPGKRYAVVTCMDARIDPSAAFGISLGDAHVIRNAGGNASDALRSLVISQQLLGTQEVLLIKHTGCGMLTFANEDVKKIVKEKVGEQAGREVESWDFGPFPDLDAAVRKDVDYLNKSPSVAGARIVISGWVYEVETGKVRKVV
ncbi:MAG: hypothetical protein Q9227_005888 [Pyrenula ochraceoflavens]